MSLRRCNRVVTCKMLCMENERNRTLSEEKLISAVSEMIEETGFEKLGINQ